MDTFTTMQVADHTISTACVYSLLGKGYTPNMTALPDNFSISIGYIPEDYSYEVYNIDGRLLYKFEFYQYHKLRELVNKATRSGHSIHYVVAINFKGQRVFYTNMKRQKALEPMHWRQTRAEVE